MGEHERKLGELILKLIDDIKFWEARLKEHRVGPKCKDTVWGYECPRCEWYKGQLSQAESTLTFLGVKKSGEGDSPQGE